MDGWTERDRDASMNEREGGRKGGRESESEDKGNLMWKRERKNRQ